MTGAAVALFTFLISLVDLVCTADLCEEMGSRTQLSKADVRWAGWGCRQ